MEGQSFLHLPPYKGRVETESELAHHCSNAQQAFPLKFFVLSVLFFLLLKKKQKNRAKFHWRQVPKKQKLSEAQLKKRKVFVDKHIDYSPEWWVNNMDLCIDGVLFNFLIKGPASLVTFFVVCASSFYYETWSNIDQSTPKFEQEAETRSTSRQSHVDEAWRVDGPKPPHLQQVFLVPPIFFKIKIKIILLKLVVYFDLKSMGISWARRFRCGVASVFMVGLPSNCGLQRQR